MKRPCKYPGCSQLVTNGEQYCDKHAASAVSNQQMPLSDPRGSIRWKKLRDIYLSQHPLCEQCQASQRVKPAIEVHHVNPIANGGSCFDEENLMALCTECHDDIHRRDHTSSCKANVYIVCGPPASGKTTYVKQNMKPGDVVVDWDAIYSAISFENDHIRPLNVRPFVKSAFDHILADIEQAKSGTTAWIIRTAARGIERRKLKRRFNAKRIIIIATKPELCEQRIAADTNRIDKADWIDAVHKWWREYEPEQGDEVICH